jgi:hypothetical protein
MVHPAKIKSTAFKIFNRNFIIYMSKNQLKKALENIKTSNLDQSKLFNK